MRTLAIIFVFSFLVAGCAEGMLLTVDLEGRTRDVSNNIAVAVAGFNSQSDSGSASSECRDPNEGMPLTVWIEPGSRYSEKAAIRVEGWFGRDRVWLIEDVVEFDGGNLVETTLSVPSKCVDCGGDRFCDTSGNCRDESVIKAFSVRPEDYRPSCLAF